MNFFVTDEAFEGSSRLWTTNVFFFSSRRRHTRLQGDWSSDVCSSDLHGLHSQYIPDPNAEIGHCVHRIAMHKSRPKTLYMQKHWDVMRTDDAGENWKEEIGRASCRERV